MGYGSFGKLRELEERVSRTLTGGMLLEQEEFGVLATER